MSETILVGSIICRIITLPTLLEVDHIWVRAKVTASSLPGIPWKKRDCLLCFLHLSSFHCCSIGFLQIFQYPPKHNTNKSLYTEQDSFLLRDNTSSGTVLANFVTLPFKVKSLIYEHVLDSLGPESYNISRLSLRRIYQCNYKTRYECICWKWEITRNKF